jgi:uncharacterized membrane protein
VLVAVALVATPASAAYITVHGGPSYTSPASAFAVVNDAGTAAATVSENNGPAPGTNFLFPSRAFRWNASGAPPVELGNLGTYVGSYSTRARAINNAGIIVGSASNTAGVPDRPVRWDPSGTAATALQGIDDNGTEPNFLLPGAAMAINDAGTAVGYTEHWAATYNYTHDHAARWGPSGTAVTALGHPGNADLLYTTATAINNSGTIIGFGEGGGHRWDPSGTQIQSLNGTPEAINDAGTVVGATYYYRAARWDAASATPTELDSLASGSYARAWDINNAGTAVGTATSTSTGDKLRAVRWDAGGVAVTELGTLSTLAYSYYVAAHVNDAGAIVGTASDDFFFQYPQYPTTSTGRAIFWGLDGAAVDLNTLIDPQSGWTLTAAQGLSNTGWVVGTGTFDPDGPGGQAASDRMFLMQLPAAVPEPGALALLGLAIPALLRRCRPRDAQLVHPRVLGIARYRGGDVRGALTALEKDPERVKARGGFFLAMTHCRLGNKDGARRAYDRAVEWNKGREADEVVIRFRSEAVEMLGVIDRQAQLPASISSTATALPTAGNWFELAIWFLKQAESNGFIADQEGNEPRRCE